MKYIFYNAEVMHNYSLLYNFQLFNSKSQYAARKIKTKQYLHYYYFFLFYPNLARWLCGLFAMKLKQKLDTAFCYSYYIV